jgi:hypothetical protein
MVAMSAQMIIDGQPVPIGEVAVRFQHFLEDGPPHAWLDLHSNSDDSSLGGVAINCLNVGDVSTLDKLCGTTLVFGQGEEFERAELTESVFWRPGDQTLELQELQLRFGQLDSDGLSIEIAAVCFDHKKNGIQVLIRAQAVIEKR